MTFTPTMLGLLASGASYWTLLWSFLFKADHLPGVKRIIKKDRVLDWMTRNKAETLICTEILNLGTHAGVSAVPFAIGGTCVNAFTIFCVLPVRSLFQRRRAKQGKIVLSV